MIAWIIGSRIGRALSGLVVAVGAFLGVYIMGRRDGAENAENEALRDNAERQEDGRNAVNDLRGADRDDLIDRLRENDGQW